MATARGGRGGGREEEEEEQQQQSASSWRLRVGSGEFRVPERFHRQPPLFSRISHGKQRKIAKYYKKQESDSFGIRLCQNFQAPMRNSANAAALTMRSPSLPSSPPGSSSTSPAPPWGASRAGSSAWSWMTAWGSPSSRCSSPTSGGTSSGRSCQNRRHLNMNAGWSFTGG